MIDLESPGGEIVVVDGTAEFIPGETFIINLESPGGEIAGRADMKGWLRKDARRRRAKRYSRFPAWRYRASWRAW
jgi:hypothetical protein